MKRSLIFASIIFSGICWYLSFQLSGDFWYLLWIAPVPVLLVSFHVPAKQCFTIAFIAYLIGRLSWLPYLLTVLPAMLAIFFTLSIPVVFAFAVVLTRRIVLMRNAWSVFAFPVLWCLFEFLLFRFSPDGTAGSIAYSEANFLPVVQVASITGILGISFLVTLVPSIISIIMFKGNSGKLPLFIATLVVVSSLVFGVIRINHDTVGQDNMMVGLGVIDEKFHSETNEPKQEDETRAAIMYAGMITTLAQQGAQVIVLPEKIVNVKGQAGDSIKKIIRAAAGSDHAMVVAGYTEFKTDNTKHNNALVISPGGNILADYQKVNLFEGEAMNHFVPGDSIATFSYDVPSGVAICKDMDYQNFMTKYADDKTQVLYVPAWDFIKDGWLHSRMAVLRGVENGYAVVRSARQGRLTVSDVRGKILYEASCENNKAATLVGKIRLGETKTIYSRFGDWFGYTNIVAAVYFFISLIRKKRGRKM